MIEIRFERFEQIGRRFAERVALQQPRFHQMRQLTEAHRAGHSGAAFERVQRPAQLLRGLRVARAATPRAHLVAGLRIELRRFFEEDFQHLRVDVVSDTGERIAHFLRRLHLAVVSRAMGRRRDRRYEGFMLLRRV